MKILVTPSREVSRALARTRIPMPNLIDGDGRETISDQDMAEMMADRI